MKNNDKKSHFIALHQLEQALDVTVTGVAKIWLHTAKESNLLEDDINKLVQILFH